MRPGIGGPCPPSPRPAIVNDFAYNKFRPAAYGLQAGVGAKAIVTLPPPADAYETRAGAEVRVTDVNGKTFAVTCRRPDQPFGWR